MNSVVLVTDPNQLSLSQLSIVEEIPNSNGIEEINNDEIVANNNELPNNIVTEEKLDDTNNIMNSEKKPSTAHCADWLQKTDFSVTDSIDSESIVSEVYDTDEASSIADSDINQAIDPKFGLVKKYRQVGELAQDNNVNNTFVDTSGNTFKNISVQHSEKVYVGNVTNINIYKVKENKKPKKREDSTVEMEECVPENIFLKSKVSDSTIRPLYIIPRVRWLAQRAIDFEEFNHIPKFVVISHTATEPASSIAENVPLVRDIQSFHIESRKWSDIAYNFLIGEDGNVYEGRGWKRVGAHTLGYNKVAVGISFIGCYMTSTPPDRSLRTLSLLLEVAVKEKHITADYGLLGHCQCSPVESPGKALFAILKEHPHWIAEPQPPE